MSLSPDEHLEFDHLREELHDLKIRVDALEHRPGSAAVTIIDLTEFLPQGRSSSAAADFAISAPLHAIPVAGRALLGLAGAFLLRALADSGSVPRLIAVVIALVYTAAWLVFSRRTREQNAFAGATYGITAALIFTPLLWEATVRFRILPPAVAAVILVAFFALSSILSWSSESESVTVVVALTTLITALVLMVQTGDLASFGVALLGVAGVVEALVCAGHVRKLRVAAAIAADIGIWLIVYVMTRPSGTLTSYAPVSLPLSLTLIGLFVAIYSVSLIWQIAMTKLSMTWFTIAQWATVLSFSIIGALQLTQGRAVLPIAALCAITAVASYFAAFVWFVNSPPRAHILFGSSAVAFALVASLLGIPASGLPAAWGAAAIGSTLIAARRARPLLVVQAGVYLIAAGMSSAVPLAILSALSDDQLDPAPVGLWIVAISGASCCIVSPFAKFGRIEVVFRSVAALFTAVVSSALLILIVVPIISNHPTVAILTTMRTMVICLLALVLGVASARWKRRELLWISYLALALGTFKLVVEDFRHSHAAALAISLLCYGALLILIPRLNAQTSAKRSEPGILSRPAQERE